MKELKLIITHYKILDTVFYLNEQNLYPTEEGVFKIVHGDIDDDTKDIQNCPTFGTLISYGSKKISRLCMILVRYKFLARIFDRNTKELYLTLTETGKQSLSKYLKNRKNPFKKTAKKFKPQIVKIGE